MSSIYKHILFVFSSALTVSAVDIVNFTAGEGYVDGNLNNNPAWVAQAQWQVDSSGAGSVTSNTGAFIRGLYLGSSSTNSIGDQITMSLDFSFTSNYFSPTNPPSTNGQQQFFLMGLANTDGSAAAVPQLLGVALARGASDDSLQLRLGSGGSGTSLGNASDFDGDSFLFTTTWTKLDADSYGIASTIVASSGPTVYELNTTVDDATAGDSSIFRGIFNILPSAGTAGPDVNSYDGISIDTFTFGVVPEPGTFPLLAGLTALAFGLFRRRR
ncbi:MAG: PEP-CTERM sorting domain-containing protein [Verrucomicrobiota bacterium]